MVASVQNKTRIVETNYAYRGANGTDQDVIVRFSLNTRQFYYSTIVLLTDRLLCWSVNGSFRVAIEGGTRAARRPCVSKRSGMK